MARLFEFNLKSDYVSGSQWDVYCKTEGIRHHNMTLLDRTMFLKRGSRK